MFATPSRARRTVAAGILLAVAGSVLGGCAPSASPDAAGETAAPQLSGEIIFADFGGTTNQARQSIYFDAFTESTGVEVTSVVVDQSVAIQMLANGMTGDYDAIHRSLEQVYQYKDNVEPLPDYVTRDATLPEDIQDYAFGSFLVGHAMGYLTETYPDGGPQTWADFWDVDTYPGKRAWPGSPASYDSSCEIALLADGVAPEELYPLDFDRCIEKLDELKPDLVFYDSYPEIQQLLTSGSAVMAAGPTGQYAGLINQGVDVTISWNQAIVAPNVMVVPATAPNKDNVFALAQAMTDPVAQAAFAEATFYGPGNPEAFDHMSDEVKENIVNAPDHTEVVWQNSEERAKVRDEYVQVYTAWLAG